MKFNNSKKYLKQLLANLCCSKCRNDFDVDSIIIKEQEGSTFICNLRCQICGKDFGDVVLNINSKSNNHYPMDIIDGPPPITSDDVIDAHRFIKNMK